MTIERCGRHHAEGHECRRYAGHHHNPVAPQHTAAEPQSARWTIWWTEADSVPLADEPEDLRQRYTNEAAA